MTERNRSNSHLHINSFGLSFGSARPNEKQAVTSSQSRDQLCGQQSPPADLLSLYHPQSPQDSAKFSSVLCYGVQLLWQLGTANAKRSRNADNMRMLRIADVSGREGGHQLNVHHTVKQVSWEKAHTWLLGDIELKGLSLFWELQIFSPSATWYKTWGTRFLKCSILSSRKSTNHSQVCFLHSRIWEVSRSTCPLSTEGKKGQAHLTQGQIASSADNDDKDLFTSKSHSTDLPIRWKRF